MEDELYVENIDEFVTDQNRVVSGRRSEGARAPLGRVEGRGGVDWEGESSPALVQSAGDRRPRRRRRRQEGEQEGRRERGLIQMGKVFLKSCQI